MKRHCYKCVLGIAHPWHDNGTLNDRDLPLWEATGPYGRKNGQEGQR